MLQRPFKNLYQCLFPWVVIMLYIIPVAYSLVYIFSAQIFLGSILTSNTYKMKPIKLTF